MCTQKELRAHEKYAHTSRCAHKRNYAHTRNTHTLLGVYTERTARLLAFKSPFLLKDFFLKPRNLRSSLLYDFFYTIYVSQTLLLNILVFSKNSFKLSPLSEIFF